MRFYSIPDKFDTVLKIVIVCHCINIQMFFYILFLIIIHLSFELYL